MNKSIKATILAIILAAGAGGITCGGLTTLSLGEISHTMTNCQYNDLKSGLIAKYPTGKEIVEIDDWQLLVAVINKEIQKKGGITLKNLNQTNLLEKAYEQIK